jgi:hypothetical protein
MPLWIKSRRLRRNNAFSAVTNRAIEPLLEAANVGNATRLLDVATGPGTLAAKAAERGARVIGKCYPKNIAAFVSTCRTRRNHRNTKISDLQQLGSCPPINTDRVFGTHKACIPVQPSLPIVAISMTLPSA